MNLSKYDSEELMNVYASLLQEMNDRQIVRTFNSPVDDYAEWLL